MMIALIFSRALLLVISFKRLSICKTYFYFELLVFLVQMLMPLSRSIEDEMGYYKLLFIENFLFYYFEWSSCMMLGFAQILIFLTSRAAFHDDLVSSKMSSTLILMTLHWIFYALLYHCIITKVGLIYIDAEVMSSGHDALLNGLEEGLIIADEHTKEMQFANIAAKRIIN